MKSFTFMLLVVGAVVLTLHAVSSVGVATPNAAPTKTSSSTATPTRKAMPATTATPIAWTVPGGASAHVSCANDRSPLVIVSKSTADLTCPAGRSAEPPTLPPDQTPLSH